MPINRILLVGHCGFDSANLRATVQDAAEGVPVAEAYGDDVRKAGSDTLLLINRQLPYGYGTGSGVDLIRELAKKADPPAMILISNYEDAQRQAVAAGARPGFGKSELGDREMVDRLRAAMHADVPNPT